MIKGLTLYCLAVENHIMFYFMVILYYLLLYYFSLQISLNVMLWQATQSYLALSPKQKAQQL